MQTLADRCECDSSRRRASTDVPIAVLGLSLYLGCRALGPQRLAVAEVMAVAEADKVLAELLMQASEQKVPRLSARRCCGCRALLHRRWPGNRHYFLTGFLTTTRNTWIN